MNASINASTANAGWRVVAACALGLGLGASVTPLFTLGVFTKPLVEAFGATRSAVSFCQMVIIVASMLVAPLAGWLADRVSLRRFISLSMLAYGLGLIGLPYLVRDIQAMYAAYALLVVLGCGTTSITFTKLVSRWFDRRRGLALGVTLAGVGICATGVPPGVAWVVQHHGWQLGFVTLGALVLLLGLPAAIVLLRDEPTADAIAAERVQRSGGGMHGGGMAVSRLLRSATFWKLCAGFFFAGAGFGIIVFLVPMLTDQGMAPGVAAMVQGAMGVSLIGGRVLMGWLMDRVNAVRLGAAFLIAPAVAIPLLALGMPLEGAALCAVLIGLAQGTEGDLLAFLISRYFPMAAYGRVYALVFTCFTLGGATGGLLLAHMQQRTGSYAIPAYVLSAGLVLTMAIFLALPPYAAQPPAQGRRQPATT